MVESRRTAKNDNITGIRVLITAGPTVEDIDPVRFITNRSTGGMGIALAKAVAARGGEALLILGPTGLEPPPGIRVERVRSATDMCEAVLARLEWCDALVMAAAVADYTPTEPLDVKLKKNGGDLLLRLTRTQDILLVVKDNPARVGKVIAGFSLDIGMNINEGWRKLRDKNLDLLVANTADSFGSDYSDACLLRRDGSSETFGRIGKPCLAGMVLDEIDLLRRCGQTDSPMESMA